MQKNAYKIIALTLLLMLLCGCKQSRSLGERAIVKMVYLDESGGQVQAVAHCRKRCFTSLSSSEWNVIMHSLPPGFNSSIMSSSVSLRTSSSRFNSIRIAWNVRFAGCPDFFWYFIGMAPLIISVSWPVVSMGSLPRWATICLAMFLANLSSP